MKIVGVTGGIGSGKSSVCQIIEEMGYPVYTADSAAKDLMQSDQDLIEAIKSEFGRSIYDENKLDRAALSRVVFSDPEKLKKLNELVHPAVARDFVRWCKDQSSELVFKEAAILFETGGFKELDSTVLVHAPEEERICRVMVRDNVTRNEVLDRIKNQWSDQKKIPLADHVIENHNGHLLIPQVLKLIESLGE